MNYDVPVSIIPVDYDLAKLQLILDIKETFSCWIGPVLLLVFSLCVMFVIFKWIASLIIKIYKDGWC